jgi:hypothetical protein
MYGAFKHGGWEWLQLLEFEVPLLLYWQDVTEIAPEFSGSI